MEKLIKVTSLIGIIIQSFLTLLFLLFLILSATGIIQPELTTTVNGEQTIQSPETAQATFVTIFAILFVVSLVSDLLGIIAMKKLFVNNKASGIFVYYWCSDQCQFINIYCLVNKWDFCFKI